MIASVEAINGVMGNAADTISGSYLQSLNNTGISGNEPWSVSGWIAPKDEQTSLIAFFGNYADIEAIEIGYNSFAGGLTVTNAVSYLTPYPVVFGTWYHMVATYDGTFVSMYVNGELAGTTEWTNNITNSPLYVGHHPSVLCDVSADSLSLWNRALTADEASHLYNGGNGLSYSQFGFPRPNLGSGLVSHWKLDEAPAVGSFTTTSGIDIWTRDADGYWVRGDGEYRVYKDVPNSLWKLDSWGYDYYYMSYIWSALGDADIPGGAQPWDASWEGVDSAYGVPLNAIDAEDRIPYVSDVRYDSHGSNDLLDTGDVGFTDGVIGNGAYFSGTNYLSVDNFTQSQTFSVALWASVTAIAGVKSFVVQNTAEAVQWGIRDIDGDVEFFVGNSGAVFSILTDQVPQDEPVFFVGVCDDTLQEGRLYANGVLIGSTPFAGSHTFVPETLWFGDSGWSEPYTGFIDSVSIWDRVIDEGEILALYNAGNGLDYPAFFDLKTGLFAHWKLDEETSVVGSFTTEAGDFIWTRDLDGNWVRNDGNYRVYLDLDVYDNPIWKIDLWTQWWSGHAYEWVWESMSQADYSGGDQPWDVTWSDAINNGFLPIEIDLDNRVPYGVGAPTRVDSSPNNNDLTENNSVTSESGILGGAAVFDSNAAGYLSGPDFYTSGESLSASAWFKISNGPAYGQNPMQFFGAWGPWIGNCQGPFLFSVNSDGATIEFRVTQLGGGGNDGDGSAQTFVLHGAATTDVWYHVAFSFNGDSNELKAYFDGALVHTYTVLGGLDSSINSILQFGAGESNGEYPFDGSLDSVSIWNRVITNVEVAALYGGGFGLDYEDF
jgi:hypothetical protein